MKDGYVTFGWEVMTFNMSGKIGIYEVRKTVAKSASVAKPGKLQKRDWRISIKWGIRFLGKES